MFDKYLKRLDRKDVQMRGAIVQLKKKQQKAVIAHNGVVCPCPPTAIPTVPSSQMDLRIPQRKKMKSRSSSVTET